MVASPAQRPWSRPPVVRARTRPSPSHRRRRRRRRRRVIDYFRHHRLLPRNRAGRPEEVAASALVLAAYEDISGLQYMVVRGCRVHVRCRA